MLLTLFVLAAPLLLLAETNNTGSQYPVQQGNFPTSTSPMSTGTSVTGQVTSVNTGTGEITIIDSMGKSRLFSVGTAQITGKNNQALSLSGIKSGDTVTIQVGSDDQPTSVTVTK